MHMHRLTAGAILCLTATAPASRAQQVKPLSIEDALATRTFGIYAPISVSPDGRWVAYTIVDPRKRRSHSENSPNFLSTGAPRDAEGAELWIADTKTGATRDLTGHAGNSWDGVWSPDGSRLAFYSDRDGMARLWVWDRATATVRRVSSVIPRAYLLFETPAWTPDGASLIVKVLPEGDTIGQSEDSVAKAALALPNDTIPTAEVLTANIGSSDTARVDGGSNPDLIADLALVRISNGTVRRIVRRSQIMEYSISPTGERVAYTVLSGMVVTPEITWVYDIGVADLRTGATRIIARRVPNLWGPTISWSPDGLHIAFTTKPHSYGLQDLPDRPLPPGDCYVASVLNDSVRDLTPGAHVDLGANFQAPVWSADGSTLFVLGGGGLWRADAQRGGLERIGRVPGRAAVAILTSGPFARPWPSNAGNTLLLRTLDERTLKVGVARIDVRTGASELAYEDDEWLPGASRTAFGMSAAADVFVYQRESAAHPGDLWVADPTFLARRRLTHINPQLDDYVFGERRLIYWRSDDGDSLRGALLLPAGYKAGKRYPLISYQYGGENWSMFANNFGVIPMVGDYVQILATRGYAVLVPDAPQHIGTPMLDLAKTVLPGVNRAIELGVADPARLGIMGLSYGCFSTLMIVVQTTRFKAAECSSGASSIIGMAGTELGWAWADSGQGKMGATVWQRRDRYIENSAYFYLDRVTTPILMVNGTADRGVPSFLADATYEALRQLGKRVEYVRYVGEGHGPMYYSRANVTDYLNRLVRWFGTYFADSSGSSEPGTLR